MTATAEIATASATILIAEDSPTQAEKLKYILETQNYRVMAAVNGRLALEMAREEKPTLVISDVVMPEMDGYQLCHEIKSDPAICNIPVILVTTLSDPHDVIRGLECRADNFIIKPYEERHLLSRIQFVLVNREMREHDHTSIGVEVHFHGQRHFITADRLQILNLLLSTYEAAIQRNQELTAAKNELRRSNVSLEAANKELESFSYSVSHDLRAPLRAIHGFTEMVLDEDTSQLDDTGREHLLRVQNACTRMGNLIDDLLNLSKVTRCDFNRNPVDLSPIAKTVLAELQRAHPDRQVSCRIDDKLVANGDGRLLQIVLENLLGNAWKFTGKQKDAVIEVTSKRQDDQQVFMVRDNGAGFDMANAKNLFGAFQRMHSVEEFPGTGIGLATVQRIIQRHGGRIWAESVPGAGATFCFTL
jgi:two-component system, sensor histidine kinase and response regulator